MKISYMRGKTQDPMKATFSLPNRLGAIHAERSQSSAETVEHADRSRYPTP